MKQLKHQKTKPFTITLTCLLILTISFPVYALNEAPQQLWSKTYGPYRGWSVIQTSDGGYAVAGSNAFGDFRGYGEFPPLLVKTHPDGELDWSKTYKIEDGVSDSAFSLVQTKDQGYVLGGSGVAGWILKTDSQGNIQWNKKFTELDAYLTFKSIISSEDWYVYAGSGRFSNNSEFGFLIKTDTDGNTIWIQRFEGVRVNSGVQTFDGGYAVVGELDRTFWFAKTAANGNIALNKTYGGGVFSSIANANDQGYLLSGSIPWGDAGWFGKIDAFGNILWNQTVSGNLGSYWLGSAVQVPEGGYLAAGGIFSPNADYSLILKVDSSGNQLWNATYGGKKGDRANSIITVSGGFVVTGRMDGSVWLAKFAAEPDILAPTNNQGLSVLLLGSAIVVVAVVVGVFAL